MAVPTFVNASAKAAGTGAVTPNLPASLAANDIVVLVATTIAGGSLSITANGSIGTWNAITGSPVDVTGGEKIYVWWGRWSSGSTGPTVTPGSDHCCAGTAGYRGCITDSTVINNQATGTETTSDTSFSFATGISTTVKDCLCLCTASNGADSNSSQVPVMTNSNLASLNSRMDFCTNSGGGGGFGLSDGSLAVAGAIGTFACTMGTASPKAYIAFALRPVNDTTTKTATGKGAIRSTTTKTTTGKARIGLTTTKTQPGIARIYATTTRTQTGKSRVQVTASSGSISCDRDAFAVGQNTGESIGDASSFKWLACSFIAKASYTALAVKAQFQRTGSPAWNISAQIFSDSSGAPGSAIGGASGSVAASTFPTSGWGNGSFTGLSAALTAGTRYWLVFTASATNSSNFLFWRLEQRHAEQASAGSVLKYSSDGVSWTSGDIGAGTYFSILAAGIAGLSRITASSTRTQTGEARIKVTTTRTTTGKARITASTTRTTAGVARITATTSRTQPGKTRVQTSATATQPGKARVQATKVQEISGTARIESAANGDTTVLVSGLEATGAVGTVTVSTGAQTSTSIGWTEFVLGIISGKRKSAKVAVQGIEAIGAVGQVTVTTSANVSATGVAAMARLATGRVAISINARIRTAGGKAAIGWPDIDAIQNLQEDELCALVSLLE